MAEALRYDLIGLRLRVRESAAISDTVRGERET